MSRHGDVTLAWADGDYPFRLDLGQLVAVQEATQAGPAHLMARLSDGTWRVEDIRAPILHGLMGGGMDAIRARGMVTTWVDARPWVESIPVALAILGAAIYGAPADDEDETEAPPEGKTPPAALTPCPPGG